MSVVFLNEPDVCRFGNLRMWTARGLIHIEDARSGAYESISTREALLRMQAISDMLGNTKEDNKGFIDSHAYTVHLRMLEQMVGQVEKAKAHGTPDDAAARRDLARRLPRTFYMGGARGKGAL